MGVPIEDCHSFYERLVSKIAITDLPPEWIALSEGFRRDRIVLAAKRVIDVIVAFLGLLLAMPLALMTALAIKLESSGPIFYRQERVGQNEKHFTLFEVSLHDSKTPRRKWDPSGPRKTIRELQGSEPLSENSGSMRSRR